MSDSKQKIISDVYFDPSGFGSKSNTFKDAKAKDATITRGDVEKFFKENVDEKRKPRGMNSFVAPHNNHTFQMDLFFISQSDMRDEQKKRIGLACIDVLSKYAVVVPIDSREIPDVIGGAMEALNKMKGGDPKIIYTDDERSIASKDFQEFVEGRKIELYRTRGHPAFGERFIRSFKDMLFQRVENDEKKKNIQWTDYIFQIMLTYNNKNVHSATNQTPLEATKKGNEFKSKLNVSIQAKRQRTYPELEVGDKVKILRKKPITEKERTSHFLKGNFAVKKISTKMGQKYYDLEGFERPLMRHELLLKV